MTGNSQLAHVIRSRGLTHRETAEHVNDAIADITGSRGSVTELTVARWVSGRSQWPQARQRAALEAYFGCPVEELGFIPRPPGGGTRKDAPVNRRQFLAAGTATAVPLVVPTRRTLGTSDVERLRGELDRLTAADDRHGGTDSIEARAVHLARHTLELQQSGNASARVRGRLYGLAASYMSTAMWASVDARRPGRARRHLEQAAHLAGLSTDRAIQWRIWSHTSILALQQRNHAEALAAAEAARAAPMTRRSPLFRSLAAARVAGVYAATGDRTAALRNYERAHHALARVDNAEDRPSWMVFYDAAELAGLACVMHLDLGRPAEAEASAHHALALLRPCLQRNRAYYTAYLARAQLRQGDLDQACATAARVGDGAPPTGRTGDLLTRFGRELLTVAPDSRHTRGWITRQRETRTQE
ncbi:hypothetical protein OG948_59105 (plasmid) [Embleya sp. NBC_00888]|uniref:hypothetical protein n=1 Tax=Embleya sp. NBC_00888 TaxID=2975960 RepID=UPI002F90C59C|nr:hypothetical protein OG948_59105 [Embleya sp. NBC_00888]